MSPWFSWRKNECAYCAFTGQLCGMSVVCSWCRCLVPYLPECKPCTRYCAPCFRHNHWCLPRSVLLWMVSNIGLFMTYCSVGMHPYSDKWTVNGIKVCQGCLSRSRIFCCRKVHQFWKCFSFFSLSQMVNNNVTKRDNYQVAFSQKLMTDLGTRHCLCKLCLFCC